MPGLADIFRGIDTAAGGMAGGLGVLNEMRYKETMAQRKRQQGIEDKKQLLELEYGLKRKEIEWKLNQRLKNMGVQINLGGVSTQDLADLDKAADGNLIKHVTQNPMGAATGLTHLGAYWTPTIKEKNVFDKETGVFLPETEVTWTPDKPTGKIKEYQDLVAGGMPERQALAAAGVVGYGTGGGEEFRKAEDYSHALQQQGQQPSLAQSMGLNVPGLPVSSPRATFSPMGDVAMGMQGSEAAKIEKIKQETAAKKESTPLKMDKGDLTDRYLHGATPEIRRQAKENLDEMARQEVAQIGAKAKEQLKNKLAALDISGLSDMVAHGDATPKDIPNTALGIPVKAAVLGDLHRRHPEYNVILTEEDRKTVSGGLALQRKTLALLDPYVANMEKQLLQLQNKMRDISQRIGIRALDLPYVKLKKELAGSAYEAIVSMYTLEFSQEMAKVALGTTASVRETSAYAQERWRLIHDPNLSPNKLFEIMNETLNAAHFRQDTLHKAMEDSKALLGDITNQAPYTPHTPTSGVSTTPAPGAAPPPTGMRPDTADFLKKGGYLK